MGILDRFSEKIETLKYAKEYINNNFESKNYDYMMQHIKNVCDKRNIGIIDTASVLDESAKHYNEIMRNR